MERFRDYGFKVGLLNPGPKNSLADVQGVKVGHFSKIEGDDIRTGITIIDPGPKNLFREKLPATIAVGNGYGKLAGYTQVEELGTLEAPIALTHSLAIGPTMQGVIDIVIKESHDLGKFDSINTIVADVNDGRLNAIHKVTIRPEDVANAWENRRENFEVGNIGGGTGARAYSWKGGIASASREVIVEGKTYMVATLVQTNFGGTLTILGVPVGQLLGKTDFDAFVPSYTDGSCIFVLATDAPLTARQLKRIAARSFVGMGRTGAVIAHASGDYAIAFSTNRAGVEGSGVQGLCLKDEMLNPFFLASVECAEESIYDALFYAETMTGNGMTLEALPKDKVINLIKDYRR